MLLNPKLFVLPHEEIKAQGLQNLTYGSLTMKGVHAMSHIIQKHIKSHLIQGFDLGCGDGELIYHFQQSLPESTWYGVEISDHRVSSQVRDVCIWQGDMLKESFKPYTVLHADNLCLEDSIACSLEKKIADEFTGLYITYRKPSNLHFLKKAILLETVTTETSWSECLVSYYWIGSL